MHAPPLDSELQDGKGSVFLTPVYTPAPGTVLSIVQILSTNVLRRQGDREGERERRTGRSNKTWREELETWVWILFLTHPSCVT